MDSEEWFKTTMGFLRKMSKICSTCINGGSTCARCRLDGVEHLSEYLMSECPKDTHRTNTVEAEILDQLKEHGRTRLDGIKTSSFVGLKEKLKILDDLCQRGIIRRKTDGKKHAYYEIIKTQNNND